MTQSFNFFYSILWPRIRTKISNTIIRELRGRDIAATDWVSINTPLVDIEFKKSPWLYAWNGSKTGLMLLPDESIFQRLGVFFIFPMKNCKLHSNIDKFLIFQYSILDYWDLSSDVPILKEATISILLSKRTSLTSSFVPSPGGLLVWLGGKQNDIPGSNNEFYR